MSKPEARSCGLAERMAEEIVEASAAKHGYSPCGQAIAAEAVRRTIALVVEEIEAIFDAHNESNSHEPIMHQELARRILALLDGEEKP